MNQDDEMRPLPTTGEIAPGTLVWGSLFNASCALLYRWWSILDAPADANTTRFWDDLFEDKVQAATPELEADGIAALRNAVAALDRAAERSHHLGYDDIRVRWQGPGTYEVRASYSTQCRTKDAVLSDRRTCVMAAIMHDGGPLLIRRLTETVERTESDRPFEPSFVFNRARATSTRFQAHMDSLTGNTDDMRDLMMPVLELHGLVAAKKDESTADADYSDVNELRKSIAGSDTVADNVIRDFDGFTAWFATAPALFNYGLHKLERLEVKPLPDRRYETIAQYDWRAETVNGAKIETHHPLTWVLVDTDEAYMRIEKLLPF